MIVTHRRLFLGFSVCVVLALLTCAAGFAWFLGQAGRGLQAPMHTDGIVAFTGGPERVETALRLLAEGRADRLLLSGIGGGAELAELARLAGIDPAPLALRVTIDRRAATTRGNAVATADWARANNVHSLLVVTAAYHMPRALTELSRTLPDVQLYPLPVVQTERSSEAPLRLVAEEYVKFLASATGLTAMLPEREPAPHRGGHAG